jgi:hypothetical protein
VRCDAATNNVQHLMVMYGNVVSAIEELLLPSKEFANDSYQSHSQSVTSLRCSTASQLRQWRHFQHFL